MTENFQKFFTSRPNTLGQTTLVAEKDKALKKGAICTTLTKTAEFDDYQAHINGEKGLGLNPLLYNNKVEWAAIDIDDYSLDINKYSIKFNKLPVFFCNSKSGGIHIFCFFDKPIQAKEAINFLEELALLMGFIDPEIFPKQAQLTKAQQGNWINLPYFGDTRKCVYSGIPLSLEQFTQRIESSKISEPKNILAQFMLSSAPPCLQKYFAQGVEEGCRDVILLNTAVFLKLKYPKNWEVKLKKVNNDYLSYPLDDRELERHIISQVRKDNIFYQCKTALLSANCNKTSCSAREFGIRGNNRPEALLGDLKKIDTDPPTWLMDVCGKEVELSSEELLNQGAFRKKCMEAVNKIPPMIKNFEWDCLLQEKLDTAEIIDAPPDADNKASLNNLILEYCEKRSNTKAIDDTLNGNVWIDTEEKVNLFKGKELIRYINKKSIVKYKNKDVYAYVTSLGGVSIIRKINKTAQRLWSIPLFEEQLIKKTNEKKLEKVAWSEFEKDLTDDQKEFTYNPREKEY